MIRHLGPDPFETYTEGRLKGLAKNGMLCVYPSLGIVVSGSGTHGDCHQRLVEAAANLNLDSAKQAEWRQDYVAGVVRGGNVLLRADGHDMGHVFMAAEMLEAAFPDKKESIRYLGASDPRVRDAVRRRCELWRISPPAHTHQQMKDAILGSMVKIGTDVIYYFNPQSGTRYLTSFNVPELLKLLPDRQQLCADEIVSYFGRTNKRGNRELVLFNADFKPFGTMADIAAGFKEHMIDDTIAEENMSARVAALYRAISGEEPTEEEYLGLCPELKMKIKWLPGGRPDSPGVFHPLASERTRGIVGNFLSDFRAARFINIGNVIESNSHRPPPPKDSRREVFVAQVGFDNRTECFIVRMQDWDEWQYLDKGASLEDARTHADEYSRYLAHCRYLAMLLGLETEDVFTHRVKETYKGANSQHEGRPIDARYFARKYVHGIATDKLPEVFLERPPFAKALASLLGSAAASNMVVGRARDYSGRNEALFNDGDEYVILGENGMPEKITVGDATGCFCDYQRPFSDMRPDYEKRMERIFRADPQLRNVFVESLVARYREIYERYIRSPKRYYRYDVRTHADLRKMSLHDDHGSFKDRAKAALERFRNTPPDKLKQIWA